MCFVKTAKGKEGVRRNHVMEKMLIQIRIKKKRKALKKNHLTQHYSSNTQMLQHTVL
jgi:hypothetical protein